MEGRIHIGVPQWLPYQMIISQRTECSRYCIMLLLFFLHLNVACYQRVLRNNVEKKVKCVLSNKLEIRLN